jgi:hypothetical protein
MRYAPFPINMPGNSSDLALVYNHPLGRDLLAISDDQSVHVELKLSDLAERCWRFNSNWVCDSISVLARDTKATCLGGLYTGNFDAIRSQCQAHRVTADWQVEKLQPDLFLLFAAAPMQLQIQCRNGSRTSTNIQGYGHLHITSECNAVSDFFLLQTTTMNDIMFTWSYPVSFKVEDSLEGHSVDDLTEMARKLEALHIKPDDDIEDMIAQAQLHLTASTDLATSHGLFHVGFGAIGLFLLLVFGGLLFLYLRARGSTAALHRLGHELTIFKAPRPNSTSEQQEHST